MEGGEIEGWIGGGRDRAYIKLSVTKEATFVNLQVGKNKEGWREGGEIEDKNKKKQVDQCTKEAICKLGCDFSGR